MSKKLVIFLSVSVLLFSCSFSVFADNEVSSNPQISNYNYDSYSQRFFQKVNARMPFLSYWGSSWTFRYGGYVHYYSDNLHYTDGVGFCALILLPSPDYTLVPSRVWSNNSRWTLFPHYPSSSSPTIFYGYFNSDVNLPKNTNSGIADYCYGRFTVNFSDASISFSPLIRFNWSGGASTLPYHHVVFNSCNFGDGNFYDVDGVELPWTVSQSTSTFTQADYNSSSIVLTYVVISLLAGCFVVLVLRRR